MEIDCTSKQFKVKSICAIFRSGENAAVQPLPNKKDFFTFSLLGAVSVTFNHSFRTLKSKTILFLLQYNDSFNGRFTVLRGKKNIHDVARIVEIDGKPQLSTWLTDEANQFVGTDGYFMPPLMNIHEPIFAFERMICVSLGLEYERKQFIRGFPMPTFTKNLKHFAADKGYCRKNGSCPLEGTLDLFNCMGVPIVATLPHFLDADPSLLENVESGLEPVKKDHEIFASVDLVSCRMIISSFASELNGYYFDRLIRKPVSHSSE